MTPVSTYDDDALGQLDATALAQAIRSGAVSRVEVVDAAIARTRKADPRLNGLAYEVEEAQPFGLLTTTSAADSGVQSR